MQVVGFNFNNISAEKKKENSQGKISINSNISIDEIKKEKIDVFKGKNTLKFSFTFTITYNPNLAEFIFKGSILTIVEDKEEKEILKKFKKKKVEDKYRIPLFNIILTRSSIKALQLEEDLQLPTHIPFPRINPNQNQANYTG